MKIFLRQQERTATSDASAVVLNEFVNGEIWISNDELNEARMHMRQFIGIRQRPLTARSQGLRPSKLPRYCV